MANVCQSDGRSSGNIEFDLGSDQAEVWISVDLWLSAAALQAFDFSSRNFIGISDNTHVYGTFVGMFNGVDVNSTVWTEQGGGGVTGNVPLPAAKVWQALEMHYSAGGVVEFYVDGALVWSDTAGADTVRYVGFGIFAAITALLYLRGFKIGSTRHGSEFFADDLSSGDLSAWSSVLGTIQVIADPFTDEARLYGGRGTNRTSSDLYILDPVTPAVTSLGPMGYALTGLCFDPTDGTLYGASSGNSSQDPDSLVIVDPQTAETVTVGSFQDGSRMTDLACDAEGNLFGWNGVGGLFSINKSTGQATDLGGDHDPGVAGGALAFDAGGTLWIFANGDPGMGGTYYTLDPVTGNSTLVGPLSGDSTAGGDGRFGAASFDASDVLYAADNRHNASLPQVFIGTIDVGSGAVTLVSPQILTGLDAIAWSPPPPPPPPPRVRVYADLPIRTFVTTKEARTLSTLDHRATDRQFLWVLNGPAYHTAQVASDDLEINQPFPNADSPANLTNNRRLIYALQRWQGADPPYQPIFGGILMTPEDQGTDTPTTRYTAYDGWQYMMSRPVRNPETGALPGPNGLTFASGSLASDIALGLLEITEIIDGETHIEWYSGDIEASDPLPSAITFDAGLSVGEAWQQLCNTGTIDIHLDPIYEPIDLPGKINRFRVVAQSAGSAAGPIRYNVVMGWDKGGRSLAGVNRLVDGTRLANKIKYFAGQGGTPVPTQTDAASVTAYGQYWAQQFFPGSNDITTIALLAVAELAIRRNGARSISLDPAPERVEIPLRDYGLGDYLPVWASKNLREPLGIDYDSFDPDNPGASGYQRVYAIPMQVDDNGVAKVAGILTSKEN